MNQSFQDKRLYIIKATFKKWDDSAGYNANGKVFVVDPLILFLLYIIMLMIKLMIMLMIMIMIMLIQHRVYGFVSLWFFIHSERSLFLEDELGSLAVG